MKEIAQLLRKKIGRSEGRTMLLSTMDIDHDAVLVLRRCDSEETTTHRLMEDRSRCCWLCGEKAASDFLVQGSTAPLCFECFLHSYHAFLRPVLLLRGAEDAQIIQRIHDVSEERQKTDPALWHSRPPLPMRTGTSMIDVLQSEEGFLNSKAATALRASRRRNASPTKSDVEQSNQQRAPVLSLWCCPRCTFINTATTPFCEACYLDNPMNVHCTACKQLMGDAEQVRSDCPIAKKPHALWVCSACTFLNTVEGHCCSTCNTRRLWQCSRCLGSNSSRPSAHGDKFCSFCGHRTLSHKPEDDVAVRRMKEEMDREIKRQKEIEQGTLRIAIILKEIGVSKNVQLGDGNCLFRALASQLWNDPEAHMLVRQIIVGYIDSHEEQYRVLFDDPAVDSSPQKRNELQEYLLSMSHSGTWGDELCLHAASRAFLVNLHVLSSAASTRWYLHFEAPPHLEPAAHAAGERSPNVFLVYYYPTHYDDIVRPPIFPELMKSLQDRLTSLLKEESAWDHCSVRDSNTVQPTEGPITASGEDESWCTV